MHKHGIDEQKEYATEQPSQVWPTYHKSRQGSSGSLLSDGIDSPPLFSPIGSFKEYSRSNSRSNSQRSIDVQGVRCIIAGRSKSGRSIVEEEDGDISSIINTNDMNPNQLSKFNDSLIDRGNKMLWRQNSNLAPRKDFLYFSVLGGLRQIGIVATLMFASTKTCVFQLTEDVV